MATIISKRERDRQSEEIRRQIKGSIDSLRRDMESLDRSNADDNTVYEILAEEIEMMENEEWIKHVIDQTTRGVDVDLSIDHQTPRGPTTR